MLLHSAPTPMGSFQVAPESEDLQIRPYRDVPLPVEIVTRLGLSGSITIRLTDVLPNSARPRVWNEAPPSMVFMRPKLCELQLLKSPVPTKTTFSLYG